MTIKKHLVYKEDVLAMAWVDDEDEVVSTSDIECMLPVDAVVIAHGHWIQDDEYDICSVCNNPIIMNRLSPDKWCKNCGAKMDGGKYGK